MSTLVQPHIAPVPAPPPMPETNGGGFPPQHPKIPRPSRRNPVLAAALLLLLTTGCALFETREAELPDGAQSGVFLQPDRPEIVLDNLISAVQNLNTANYLRGLDPNTFTYNPSGAALTSNPELWSDWGIDQEQTYFNNLRAAAENTRGHQLVLSNITNELISASRRQLIADYRLTVMHNRSNIGVPTLISGRMILELESGEDGLWRIIVWTDITSGSNFSWSDLRASFLTN